MHPGLLSPGPAFSSPTMFWKSQHDIEYHIQDVKIIRPHEKKWWVTWKVTEQKGSQTASDTSHSSRAMAQGTSGIEYHTMLHPLLPPRTNNNAKYGGTGFCDPAPQEPEAEGVD